MKRSSDAFVRVRGARLHNLKAIDLDFPRNALVAFTGISGSGKSSLAFGTLYAEAQRRYLESVAPYARRLFQQLPAPEVDRIEGLPPAVALRQQGAPSTRSSVGSSTGLSNRLRMLFSRTGAYPPSQPHLDAECFSPNTPEGACPACHGLGRVIEATEASMVPDDRLTIRERAIAAWPPAWHGQNLRDILVSLGFDIDRPWRDLPKKDRNWILFTEEQPVVPVYAGLSPAKTRKARAAGATPSYQGTFIGARRYVLQTLATSQSATVRRRVSRYVTQSLCPGCGGRRLRPEALSVTLAGRDIAQMSSLPVDSLADLLRDLIEGARRESASVIDWTEHPEKAIAAERIIADMLQRTEVLAELGLGYLSLDRETPTLSPGEYQRVRLAAQLSSELFGVVYVLDEPSAGLHPADTGALIGVLRRLKEAGNTVAVVEHNPIVIRSADWIVDVGPGAGADGGLILHSGPLDGLAKVATSHTAASLFGGAGVPSRTPRAATAWLRLRNVSCNNLNGVDVDIPLGVMTAVTGVSGSGKSSLVAGALVELVMDLIGRTQPAGAVVDDDAAPRARVKGRIEGVPAALRRLVVIDQKPIGRTPRSNLATYTGLLDHVRKRFAATDLARARGYSAGRFSFNLAEGRCPACEGEGAIVVELLFMPSVYARCPTCKGARYNPETLEVTHRGRSIADVLAMTVAEARDFFDDDPPVSRCLDLLGEIGLDYLMLGQPATELSGGEAQRVKLATELQSPLRAGGLYVLDEPSSGLHPYDTARLIAQLARLVDSGNSVVLVEHDMSIVASSDWVIDLGPGAGHQGGNVVASGRPQDVARADGGPTARYLSQVLSCADSAGHARGEKRRRRRSNSGQIPKI
ncbi:excinuclease ABC subunit UvrA [Hyphomicrobium sp.]|uniref:excinuclease ABC subunit UvrA n=1 Tax=Hyphomicrobium sp. TaxID=82 RepID=UPI002FE1FE5B